MKKKNRFLEKYNIEIREKSKISKRNDNKSVIDTLNEVINKNKDDYIIYVEGEISKKILTNLNTCIDFCNSKW